jgi:parvulin-like peptidyl-prolyl isomerase
MNSASDDSAANEPHSWFDFTHTNLKRSLFLAGAGASIGLLMAGYALFTAKGTSTLVLPAEDVALVNQQPIARSDYYLQLKALYNTDYEHATAEELKKVLEAMIREELFVQRGKELDVASVDTDVRAAMVNAVEQSIAADVIASRPSDDTLKTFYIQNRAVYSSEGWMTLRDLVFPPTSAAAVEQALTSRQNVDAVVAQFRGKDSGRVKGEEFYFAAQIHLGDTMFEAAKALANGTVSAPMPSPDGVHILFMIDNHPPVPQSFEEARAKVLNDYQKAAIARLLSGDEQFLRKRANVLTAEDLR